jgi:hypothetical protein
MTEGAESTRRRVVGEFSRVGSAMTMLQTILSTGSLSFPVPVHGLLVILLFCLWMLRL